uniref:protein-tyrosine-phosphatase n=1 Tax=Soboliphyme baturini TaxID=241478 RepID=A0A183IE11_9BILA
LPNFNFDTTASDKSENTFKNRYNDIKAFDVTRVKLKESENLSGSDYINANFVQGYKGRKVFIAAQGPTQDTVNDFWQMIWEQNVSLLIMVTNLQERYRTICIKYWPEHSATRYGCVEVKPLECSYFADYVIRKFQLEYVNYPTEEEAERPLKPPEHLVVQYHYTGWHDYRAPEETAALLRFKKQLRKLNSSPIVVHCSAGVGRTGTFIAIDSMMDQMSEEGTVDIFGFVSNMRRQRNFMVQCLEQYVFIYKALAEWYLFGDTDVEIEKIDEHVKKLRNVDCEPNLMSEEFNKLSLMLEDNRGCEFARKEHNVSKNRFSDLIPYDRFRIILSPVFGFDDASYINASPVRGYFNTFILTQDPLAETLWDFWRMISEQGAGSIVMLSEESSLSENERKELREVVQYCYTDWTGMKRKEDAGLVPNGTASFLDLIGKVLQRQVVLAKLGPIVIHCRYWDGSSRSGLYCAVSLLLERLRAENRVDVFQTVKTLRARRPVSFGEQYSTSPRSLT